MTLNIEFWKIPQIYEYREHVFAKYLVFAETYFFKSEGYRLFIQQGIIQLKQGSFFCGKPHFFGPRMRSGGRSLIMTVKLFILIVGFFLNHTKTSFQCCFTQSQTAAQKAKIV